MNDGPLPSCPLTGHAALGGLIVLEHLTEMFSISAALANEPTVSFEKVLLVLEIVKRDPTLFPPEVVAAFDTAVEAEVD